MAGGPYVVNPGLFAGRGVSAYHGRHAAENERSGMKRTLVIATVLAVVTLCVANASGAAAPSPPPDRVACPSGHRAAPDDLGYLARAQVVPHGRTFKSYPASYDLRTLGRVSPVKDQGAYGTCWAFAGLGSLESGLLAADPTVWDFSEDHLVWNAGFSIGKQPYYDGGNAFMALAYLARWGGPVNETDDGYADGSHPTGLAAQRHLSEVVFLPPRTSATDNEAIKDAVMRYGAVDVDMWWPTSGLASYYNNTADSLYTDGTHNANHDVLVVGWDDAFAATDFVKAAPGPGAFLVKNSWGASFGAAGYFWVSYYDTTFAYGGYNMAFVAAEPSDRHVRAYQYDPLGFWPGDGPYVRERSSWFANVFKAVANEDLTAVGFYTPLAGCSYEIYTSATSGAPSFTKLSERGAGTIATPGYHVVDLDTAAAVISGQPFTIAVKLTVPSVYHRPIPVERPYTGYSNATAKAGQSYVCIDGSTWRDLTTLSGYTKANVCLKGFTSGLPGGALRVNGGKAYTNSTSVRLQALISGAAEMRLRDAGGAWTEWMSFAASRTWALPSGDGAKTIEAEFRNDLGTTAKSATISLDTVRPVTKAPYERRVRRDRYVRLYYKVTDAAPCAAKATVTIKIKTLGGRTKKTLSLGRRAVNKLQSCRFKCSLPKRTYRFYVYATDLAGNTQSVLGRNYLYVE